MIEGKEAAQVEGAARDLAAFVRKTGRSVRVFGAIPPIRKIMHTAVNEDESIQNQSSGFGMFRHLIFNPAAPGPDAGASEIVEETNTDPGDGA